ncbi:MAG: gliding motility protein GldN [Muribaculaceae bacterium]|nr:gliding motility protein GldN [Muribaculaceae bacterium]
MNILSKHIFVALTAAIFSLSGVNQAQAQTDDDASQSSVVRRGGSSVGRAGSGTTRRGQQEQQAQPGVTQRMQSFYEGEQLSDADLQWMRVIYRQLDLNNPKNAALYFPEDIIDGQENLFRIIMRLVADNQVPAYEYLDGREIFTDEYRLKTKDMLDRFYIPYTDAKGSTEKNPKFTIEESDVPTNEVLSYYILERWEFDSRSNNMRTQVEAICPVLHRAGEWGGDEIKYPMFWIRLENLRPYLAQQYIFIDDDNNLPKYTYDDFFAMNMYEGDIYKTRNLMNKSMAQMFPNPDDMKRAQDSIQNRLDTFDDKIWVPSREEVIAAREAREAAAGGDSIKIKERDEKKESAKSSRTSRGSKEAKVKKPKQPKTQSTNSNAARSVRRRK